MNQPSGQKERSEGRGVVAACSVILFWGVVIFLRWQDAMHAHDDGHFEASYHSYGVMLLTTLLAILSTWAVVALVSWLKHKRLTKTHQQPRDTLMRFYRRRLAKK
jgi:uncharacterized membrane protein